MFIQNQATKEYWNASIASQNSRWYNVEIDNPGTDAMRFRKSDGLVQGAEYGDMKCLRLVLDLEEADLQEAYDAQQEAQREAKAKRDAYNAEREEGRLQTMNLASKILDDMTDLEEQVPGIYTAKLQGFQDKWNRDQEPYEIFIMVQPERSEVNYDDDFQPIETPRTRWNLRITWSEMDCGRIGTPSSTGIYICESLKYAVALFFAARSLGTSTEITAY